MRQNILRLFIGVLIIGVASAREENCSRVQSHDARRRSCDRRSANNPELNFYAAEIAAAKGERRTAVTRANPEASTQLGYKGVRGDDLSGDGIAFAISMQQPFEWPGRIALRKAIAGRQIQLAELGVSQFRAALAARVRTIGYKLFAAQEKAKLAREVADRFQALREVLSQRDTAGLAATLETRIIEATEIGLQRTASEASIEEQGATLELRQLLGRSGNTSFRIAGMNVIFAPLPQPDVLLAAARTNNFELKRREAELQQQGLKVSLARNERYPAILVGPHLSYESAADRETIVGAGVTLPLPLWNRNEGNIETARAREQQAQASLGVTQREIERKVLEHAAVYQTKLAEMSKWRPGALEQFREAAALADRHYRLGAVPISTYVELQKQYLEAADALLETKREALEAVAQVELLTGTRLNVIQIKSEEKL